MAIDYTIRGWQYARDVVSTKIPNGRLAIAACERSLRDLKNQKTPQFPYEFNTTKANKVCRFIECLPHVKGELAGKLIILEPWQIWCVMQIFGWVHSGGLRDGLRRFRRIYLEVGRGNAKSTLSSAIGLYCLTADEHQANVFSCATTRDQARLVWNDAKAMAESSNSLTRKMMEQLGVTTLAHSIIVEKKNSSFVTTSSDAKSQDGLNISLAIVDECHAHNTRDLWDVMMTGCGKRAQSLLLAITTAGNNRAGICYEVHTTMTKILNQIAEDETQFGCIWSADPEDDFKLPDTWQKANPNYNISVDPSHLENQARNAIITPAAQDAFRTKHLCQWVSSSSAAFDLRKWKECEDTRLRLADFEGRDVFIGVDLASVSDLAAKVYIFPELSGDLPEYYLFAQFYLSEDAIRSGKNSQYEGWKITGELTETMGNVTDYGIIEGDLKDDCKKFNVQEIAFDPYQAQQMMQNMMAYGAQCVEVRPQVMNFSEPMKELDRLSRSYDQRTGTSRLHWDGNEVMRWCVGNCVNYKDAKDNIYPRKDNDDDKIDGVVAAIMALNRALFYVSEEYVYTKEDRGFRIFG